MSKTHSRNSKFKWNGIELSDDVPDVGMDRTVDEAEVTTLASSAKEFLVGLADGMVSGSGFWGTGASELHAAMYADFVAGNSRAFSYGPGGAAVTSYDGNGYLTKFSVKSSVGSAVTVDFEIRATGAIVASGTYSVGT